MKTFNLIFVITISILIAFGVIYLINYSIASKHNSTILVEAEKAALKAERAALIEHRVFIEKQLHDSEEKETELQQSINNSKNEVDKMILETQLEEAKATSLALKNELRTMPGVIFDYNSAKKSGCDCQPNDPLCSCF